MIGDIVVQLRKAALIERKDMSERTSFDVHCVQVRKEVVPDEKAEISELGKAIREAIATLPQKDRLVVEYRFYRNMQVKEIAAQVGLSSSRITRIVQSALNYVREYLQKREHYGY